MKITHRLGSPRHGLAKAAALGVLGAALAAFAAPGVAGAATTTYTAQAKSAGAVINLFGTELTGGTASVSVDSGAPSATATGVGTLTPGLVEKQTATANGAGQSQSFPKACSQGGSLPASSPIGVTLGLACSSASAAVSGSGVPTASATGEIAGLDVNVSGLLNQILSSGGDQLFSGIQQVLGQLNGTPLGTGATACPDPSGVSAKSTGSGSGGTPLSSLSSLASTASQPGTPLNGLLGSLGLGSSPAASSPGPLGSLLQGLCQTLTNIENVVKGANPPSTLVVHVGPASASVTGTGSDSAEATAAGATAEIEVLPGVGCDASTLTACITDPSAYGVPLIDITIAPAQASDAFNGTSWTPTSKSALATVALNIPGDAQTISVAPGQSLDLLAGTPLETVIDLGSASTSGTTGSSANGATVDAVKGVNGGILLDLGSSNVTVGDTAPAAAQVTPKLVGTQSTPPAAAPSAAPAPAGLTPTLVHTGAWWSGSMPFLAGLGALGGALLGWPKFRRTAKGLGTLLRAARR